MFAVVLALLAANPYLAEGKSHFEQLAYEKALGPLTLAAQVPGLSAAERREAFNLLARTRAALGDLPGATAAYTDLLEKDPLAPAPGEAAPKIREAFRAAKAALFPPGTVKLTLTKSAADGHLVFELFDPWAAVTRLDVHEVGGARLISVAPEATVVDIRLPAGLAQAWVEALNANGVAVASLGSVKSPLKIGAAPRSTAVAARVSSSALDRAGVLSAWRADACAAARSGDAARADAAWKRSFLLDANVSPPDECKPAMATYQSARAFSAAHPPLSVKVSGRVLPQGGAHLVLEPQNDTMRLIDHARFHVRTPGGWVESNGFTVDQSSEVLGYWVEALGELGVVLTVGSTTDQLSPTSGTDAPVIASLTPTKSLSLTSTTSKQWRAPLALSLAGVAAVAAGVGIGFGIAARADAGTLSGLPLTGLITDLTQREAFALASRQRAEATTANIALGLAAGLAVTSFLIFILTAEATP